MKLQFAFGNPRKGKSKRKKGVAKRGKSRKTKSVTRKSKMKSGRRKHSLRVKSKLRKALHMAKSKRRSSKRRKNPEAALITKDKKIIGREFSPLNKRELARDQGIFVSLKQKYLKAPLGPEKNALYKKMAALKKKVEKRLSYDKTLLRYAEGGASIKTWDLPERGGSSVAKKRKKKKKSSGKKARRKSKKVSAKKVSKRRKSRSKSKRKGGSRRRRSRVKKLAKISMPKKTSRRKKSRRKGGKRRRRARMITHRHAASTRHIKKGTSFRFKTVAKKGKRKITVSGRVKVNPHRRNPMANLSAQSKKYLGLDAAELTAVAVGGLAVPLVNAGIGKIPGMQNVVAKINEMVGPQATGSVVPILAGVALNVGGDYASGDVKRYLKLTGEGLAIAGIVSLIAGLSQRYVAPMLGLSGINYTPRMGIMPQLNGMGDIRYTPNMGDIRYTPRMGIMPQLGGRADFGNRADFGEGYTEAKNRSSADFGANFSEDSEAEGLEDQDNSYSSSMN